MRNETGDMLKRFEDALAGRKLSGIAAYQINLALREGLPYRSLCEQDEKLPGIHKEKLQRIVDRMAEDGIVASKSLLTAHQRKAVNRRNA